MKPTILKNSYFNVLLKAQRPNFFTADIVASGKGPKVSNTSAQFRKFLYAITSGTRGKTIREQKSKVKKYEKISRHTFRIFVFRKVHKVSPYLISTKSFSLITN
jgi:hypothetical protein